MDIDKGFERELSMAVNSLQTTLYFLEGLGSGVVLGSQADELLQGAIIRLDAIYQDLSKLVLPIPLSN